MNYIERINRMKSIPGINGYKIAPNGDIWSVKSRIFLQKSYSKYGYARIIIKINNKHISLYPHRLVAKVFIPNPENKSIVHHLDNNKLNNHIDNLKWVTQSENASYSRNK